MTTIDPLLAHNQNLAALEEKFAGKPLYAPKPAEAPAPVEAPPPAEATPATPVLETPVAETPSPGVGAQSSTPAPEPPKPNRLQRSMEIQRRAEAAARRARTEAAKLKTPAPAPAPKPEAPASAPQVDTGAQQRIAQAEAQLAAKIRQAKTDPLAFMREQGMTGAQIAEFVRQGSDPVARSVELLRQETARETARIRDEIRAEYDQKFNALAGQIVQDQEQRAQTNFFTFVEEAKDQNPDAFKAIGSGLLYSESELWNKANEILAARPDLQKDFDEDKLLEAVETEARKDPRWSRLEPLLPKETPQQKPNAAPKTEKPNASAKVEPTEAREPPVQRPSQPRERDPQTGQFVQQRRSPFEDHTKHVDTVVNRVLGRPFGR